MVHGLPRTCDFVVVGAGVVGLTIALELRRRHPHTRIVVLDKETRAGMHASGRNSGVLHAGFYYTADSLKAALTRDGNKRLSAWCREHDVPLRQTGKLVVARSEAEHAGLDELLRRARLNGVELEDIDEDEARRIEPRARTVGRALFSPSTSAVDPKQVMQRLEEHAETAQVAVETQTAWRGRRGGTVLTNKDAIDAGYLVNAAGLYADRVAQAYGFGEDYVILPFRGAYLYGNEQAPPLRTHVYPVPDLDMPFLGVHFTVTVDGQVKIGPTALPAPWREAYRLFGEPERFSARDLGEVLSQGARLLFGNASFRRHALREAPKLSRRRLVRHAAELVPGVQARQFDRWGQPGIRAQLLDKRRGELVMDFRFEGDERSMHILNAVSPAFTCAFAFADMVVDAIEARAR